ncbi:MAG: hypothetical protein ACREBB_11200, partial [Nitrosotalea sp.]
HPLTGRIRSHWVLSRGKRYHVMAKLDPVKISWIIRQKQNGMHPLFAYFCFLRKVGRSRPKPLPNDYR